MTPRLGPDGSRTGSIETREAAIDWIIEHQLSRRNLNREERMYLLGKRYNREKAQGVKSPDGKTTAERLSAPEGLSVRAVKRAGEYAQTVDAIAANVAVRPSPRSARAR